MSANRRSIVTDLLQTTLDGLLDGSTYVLAGLGLTLAFGTLRRVNLAYGAIAMLAAYVGAWLHVRHAAPWPAVLLAMAATAVLAGAYVEWICFARDRPEGGPRGAGVVAGRDGREVVALAATFALWMQLEQLAVHLLPRHLNAFPSLAASGEWSLGPLVVRPDRLLLLALGLGLTLAVMAVLRTRTGLAWRAVADQGTAAHLAGIAVDRARRGAFAFASVLSAGAAFATLAPQGQVTPMFGMWMLTKGLVAAMLGGLGSVPGLLAGGLALGVIEAHAQAASGATGREFATYALLFAVLVWPAAWGARVR